MSGDRGCSSRLSGRWHRCRRRTLASGRHWPPGCRPSAWRLAALLHARPAGRAAPQHVGVDDAVRCVVTDQRALGLLHRGGGRLRRVRGLQEGLLRDGVEVATLDPFHGYKNAIDGQLEDAVAVLDAFYVVKLGTQAVDEVRRRVQQELHGHRGRKNDSLYGIRMILRCGAEKLTDRQRARLEKAIAVDERHDEVYVAWQCAQQQCAQQLRAAYKAKNPVEGRRIAGRSLPRCRPARSQRSSGSGRRSSSEGMRSWPTSTPAARTTAAPKPSTASSNSTARVARGFRNREHYRLRTLLIGGGSTHPHLK